ncbi:lipid-binding SYLF domain-containing protein [Zunongwangia sp. F363]|uniref:Lipid-binding SYLF domain-containing protein n=1 Tax=Autumnicola tepida TaxID=3075595 RepID=A0ABU3C7E0_9FLAO|nr:lipid-binding SYLF domain-containing protein [Zunongwangia sp. F363]MDT0642226.1 lipid-binding SYLF domain-containing protein [Zunongwangia sp. F363]
MRTFKKKLYRNLLVLGLIFFTGLMSAQTDDDSEAIVNQDKKDKLINDAKDSKAAFIQNSENLGDLFEKAAGYVIFPNVGAGAYILGGAAGNGVLFENGEVQGFAELRQVNIGLQFGGQAYRQAILFQTQDELEEFKDGEYSLSGSASAVILEKGEAKSITFKEGRAIVTMPKAGAMIEISVGGQKFEYRAEN